MKKEEKKLYKVLVDGKSCHGGDLKWSLPKKVNGKWIAGDWHEVKGEISICSSGIHLTSERFNWYKWGCTAYEAEAEDIKSWEGNKCVCRRARLLKEIPHPKWWIETLNWVETLKNIAWLKPDGKPKKEWKLFETRDAAGDAAWDAAWAAARDAARDAAGAAARDAAGDAAWAAAWAAARDAAWAAAWAAARDAAWDAAWAASRDAALYARGLIIADLKLAKEHRTHIKKRMEVWQKGYGLLCDVAGILYVYEKI
jgi:hypothetical protein